jgi:hypothetical protein
MSVDPEATAVVDHEQPVTRVYPVLLSSTVLGCAHPRSDADQTYRAFENSWGPVFHGPSCFETGEPVGPDQRTFLGVSGREAARPIIGERRVGVQWAATLSRQPHVYALLQTVSQLTIDVPELAAATDEPRAPGLGADRLDPVQAEPLAERRWTGSFGSSSILARSRSDVLSIVRERTPAR